MILRTAVLLWENKVAQSWSCAALFLLPNRSAIINAPNKTAVTIVWRLNRQWWHLNLFLLHEPRDWVTHCWNRPEKNVLSLTPSLFGQSKLTPPLQWSYIHSTLSFCASLTLTNWLEMSQRSLSPSGTNRLLQMRLQSLPQLHLPHFTEWLSEPRPWAYIKDFSPSPTCWNLISRVLTYWLTTPEFVSTLPTEDEERPQQPAKGGLESTHPKFAAAASIHFLIVELHQNQHKWPSSWSHSQIIILCPIDSRLQALLL